MIPNFNFASIPQILFGSGTINQLFSIIPQYGRNLLYVIGKNSLRNSKKWNEVIDKSDVNSLNYSIISIRGEPSPNLIDSFIDQYRNQTIDLVVGIGGGSVIDAGKAISAMLLKKDSVKDYLEGVGIKKYDGIKIPYIAVPTTSGTGSEATKNAVLSEVGPEGFKKSLRHDNLIPNYAIIDPELTISCPASVTAACGLDAFTQLLEAYTSNKSNPMTDSLAYSGMIYMKDAIIPVCTTNPSDLNLRAIMAYGALMSGICLANAGLGIVHGLASSIGGFFRIPHGVVCGTLLAESTRMNIMNLKKLGSSGLEALQKYATIGALFDKKKIIEKTQIEYYCSLLISNLEKWTIDLGIEGLGKYGISVNDIEKIVNSAGIKNNPVPLSEENIYKIMESRI
ncbi:MAG: iron-containing alcohol dehydrogenase [Candidatus Thorarchaeota archaeon]